MLGSLEEHNMIRILEFCQSLAFRFPKIWDVGACCVRGRLASLVPWPRKNTGSSETFISSSFPSQFLCWESGTPGRVSRAWLSCNPQLWVRFQSVPVLTEPKRRDLLTRRLCALKKEHVCIYIDILAHFSEAPSGRPTCHPIFCPDLLHNNWGTVTSRSPSPITSPFNSMASLSHSTPSILERAISNMAWQTHKSGSWFY